MRDYIIRRVLLMFPTLIGVTLAVFMLMHLAPGDVVMAKLVEDYVPQEYIDRMRAELGLDKPLHEQYLFWVSNVVRGELGTSLWSGTPVRDELAKRIPVSAELAALAMLVSVSIALPVGVLSAIRQDTGADYVGRFLSIGALSAPNFWLGTLILVLPAIWFGWAPPVRFVPLFQDPWTNLQQMLPAAVAMGAHSSAVVMRMSRSTLLEVLRQDYIRTAWAKGLSERVVIIRHALKNALIPVVTIWGTQLSHLLGGAVVMETIFSLPGVGLAVFQAIEHRDFVQLQGTVLFIAGVFVVMNLLVDLAYSWLDPRIRYS
ncbi:MAG TPA: ABC transporter permease [Dehalococcoidia bacterium]|nr:ABC transporter permease [Dehalococcoidia bacterium]HLE80369.1 ABC transporter permease [Dehalococcoidia bacterium]